MLWLACFAAVLLCLCAINVQAQAAEIIDSGQCGDNAYWSVDSGYTLTISGSGPMWNYSAGSRPPWYEYTNEFNPIVGVVNIESGITHIGDFAFADSALSVVHIPDTVTSIGSNVFLFCNLYSLNIPDSVTTIGDLAFYCCPASYGFKIPKSLTSMGDYAFYSSGIQEATIPVGLTTIPYNAFGGCFDLTTVVLHDGVTEIGDYAFQNCSSLESITIPSGVTSVGMLTFLYSGLKTVEFTGSVPAIDQECFWGVAATVIVPCNDASWTEAVRQNYGGTLTWNSNHTYEYGYCTLCGVECVHDWDASGQCRICERFCYHESYSDGICDACGSVCYHFYYQNGICENCGMSCEHEWENGHCYVCDTYCYHESWIDGACSVCGSPCTHMYDTYLFNNGVCMRCGQTCEHLWYEGLCMLCNSICEHSWFDGDCTICDVRCSHDDTQLCSICGKDFNAAPTACLRGDFNNWAYEANMVLVKENIVSITIPVTKAQTLSFSLIYEGETYQYSYPMSPIFRYGLYKGGNMQISFPHPGNYILYLDIQTMILRVIYMPDHMYFHCGFDDWSQDVLMTDNGDGTFGAVIILEPGEYDLYFTDGLYYEQKLASKYLVEEKSYVTALIDIYGCNSLVGAFTVGNKPIIVTPTLTLSHPTLAFEDAIQYNVYFGVDDMTSVVEMGLMILPDRNAEDAQEIISGYVANADGSYTVRTNGIPAKMLGDNVYFKVYVKLADGSYAYSNVVGYSAVAYAKTVLAGKTSDQAKALVVAMVNYGAAAQVSFGYNTDALMNAFLTEEQLALVSGYSDEMVVAVPSATDKAGSFVNNGGYANIRPTVSFEGAFGINYYFTPSYTPDDGVVSFFYWSMDDFESAEILTSENATGSVAMTSEDGVYIAAVEGIAAKQINEPVFVAALYECDGTTYTTPVIGYSLGQYCKTLVAKGNALGSAVAVYGHFAKIYFAN